MYVLAKKHNIKLKLSYSRKTNNLILKLNSRKFPIINQQRIFSIYK